MNKLIVDRKEELYTYLRSELKNKSKNNIKSLLKNNSILVNNKVVNKYNYILNIGDVIEVNKVIKNNEFNLEIIYEDEDIIVINKPSKILTISNSREKENTLYREVSNYLKRIRKYLLFIDLIMILQVL